VALKLTSAGNGKLISKEKNAEYYQNLESQITDRNPIRRLQEVRRDIAALKKEETKLGENLKGAALQNGRKDTKGNYVLKIGDYTFIRAVTETTHCDEDVLRIICKRKGYKYPSKTVITTEFDEDAFDALEFTAQEIEQFTKTTSVVKGLIGK
jgi:hypothetical protein